MRRRLHNILIIIALGSLSLGGHSCVQPLEFRETTGPSIWFNLFIPVSETIPTKAGTGNVSATDAESTLYDVQVWAIHAHQLKVLTDEHRDMLSLNVSLAQESTNFRTEFQRTTQSA